MSDEPPKVTLPSGRRVEFEAPVGRSERMLVHSPSGAVELTIRFTAAGPVVELAAAALALHSEGPLLEGLARGLGGFHDRVLIAIRFDEIVNIDACVESLARLSQAIRYPGLKIFVIDSRTEPRLPALELARERLIIDQFAPRTRDMAGALRRVIEHD